MLKAKVWMFVWEWQESWKYMSLGFLSGFSARGGHHFFSSLDVQVNLFRMHITTATSISAYMDLLATRSVQVHASA